MFKIALGAGHGLTTPGKRCDKTLDPNETSEWWLNDRVCDYVETYLKSYDGYSLLRLDDSDDGKDDIPLATRVNRANSWGADFYLSVHHNAGANRTSAGGICAFSHPNGSVSSVKWRDALYDTLIYYTGLKGNRATPKTTANFYVLRCTKMPAVLLELGFMDSKVDVPIILSDSFAKKCAKAIVEVLVERGGLTAKNGQTTTTSTTTSTATAVKVEAAKAINKAYSKAWTVTAKDGLNMRAGAGTDKAIITTLKNGTTFRCYGYYTQQGDGTIWLYGVADGKTGFCSKSYLK